MHQLKLKLFGSLWKICFPVPSSFSILEYLVLLEPQLMKGGLTRYLLAAAASWSANDCKIDTEPWKLLGTLYLTFFGSDLYRGHQTPTNLMMHPPHNYLPTWWPSHPLHIHSVHLPCRPQGVWWVLGFLGLRSGPNWNSLLIFYFSFLSVL